MKTLAQQHVEARRNPLLSVKTYGKPFDQGNANRLMYWPSKRASMPLLFLVSQFLLTAPAASTDNERSHSVAGRIMSKARCSMSGDTLDRNLMGYYWLRKLAVAKAGALKDAGRLEDLEDLDELVELVDLVGEKDAEEEVEVVEVGDGNAEEGGGDADGGGGGGGDGGGGGGGGGGEGGE